MASRLTPMDIQNQEFQSRVRGHDRDQVRMYLRSVAEEVERLNLENAELRERAGELERQAAEFRARERTLQQTLISAQKLTDEMKDKARAQADMMLQEARLKGDRLLQESQDQLTQLEVEISRRKLERDLFEKRLRLTIDEHLAMLEERSESDPEAHDRELDNLRVLRHRSRSEAG